MAQIAACVPPGWNGSACDLGKRDCGQPTSGQNGHTTPNLLHHAVGHGANRGLCASEPERAFTRPGQTHSETGGCKMKQAHKSTFEPSSRKNGAICDLCARGQERTCARPGQTRQQAADLGAKRAHNPGSSPPPALPWRKSRLVCPGQRVAEICYPHRYLSHLPIGPECPHCEKSQTTAAISAARSIDSKQSRHGETTAEPR